MRKITFLLTLLLMYVGVTPMMAQIEIGAEYRIKEKDTGRYLTVGGTAANTHGEVYGSSKKTGDAANVQIFTFIDAGNSQYYLKSKSGEYITYTGTGAGWNVNADSNVDNAHALTFESTGTTDEYKIKCYNQAKGANKYFKWEYVSASGKYHPFNDADAGAVFVLEVEQEAYETKQITSLAELSNDKVYTLKCKATDGRGFMYSPTGKNYIDFAGTVEWGDYQGLAYNANDVKQHFGIVSIAGKYYLYSVNSNKFAKDKDNFNELTTTPDDAVEVAVNNGYFSFKFESTNQFVGSIPSWTGENTGCFCTIASAASADENWFAVVEVNNMSDEDKECISQYDFTSSQFDTQFEILDAYLNYVGTVGYPAPNTPVVESARSVYSSIVENGYPENYSPTIDDYNTVKDAIAAYEASTDILMPQDGKAYIIRNVHDNDNKYMLTNDHSSTNLPIATETATANYSNVFICRVIDASENKYSFVNAQNGLFMVFHGISDTQPCTQNGFESYNAKGAGECDLILNSQNNTRMGTLSIAGLRGESDGWTWGTMSISTAGDMNANGGQNSVAYSGTYSSLFTFEEVTYPNNVKLNAYTEADLISNIPGSTIATFSAPFPTIIPNGVTAYFASENGGEHIKLTSFTGAVPASQGVILIGESATSALMIPATDEEQADLSTNMFQHSAGHKAAMLEGDYILARGPESGPIGFYPVKIDNSNSTEGTTLAINKAFLRLGTQPVSAFRLVVDETVTGIEGVATEKADAPIYDLSGRRVLNTVKGGIYIQNGKKFIVK